MIPMYCNLRSNPLNLMPNSFMTPTLLQPDAAAGGPDAPSTVKPRGDKPKPKPKAKQATNKPPKAKTPEQEAKAVSQND